MFKKLLLTALFSAVALADAPVLLPKNKRTFDQSKFIPDMSLIVDTAYVDHSVKASEIGHLGMPGLTESLMGSHAHGAEAETPYNATPGFNLNYAELVLSSSVDPFWTLDGVFHFSESGVEVEEAYVTSTALPMNLRLRVGKMLSNFGRINMQHQHYWDFGDLPLVYETFVGYHGLNEKGAQLQYTTSTSKSNYFMIGAEVLQGENEKMFGNEKLGTEDNPVHDGKEAPSLFITYLKGSADIGNTTILAGVSYAYGSTRQDHSDDETEPHFVAGNASLTGVELTVKHFFDSYSFLSWQSEWLSKSIDGTEYAVVSDTNTTVTGTQTLAQDQSGFYTQLVYAQDQNWRYGLRWDNLNQNDVVLGGVNQNFVSDYNRYSVMAEYHASEFSRIRLQYNYIDNLFNDEGDRVDLRSVTLQFNFAIGAHAAHDF